jgi:hypothetical protein
MNDLESQQATARDLITFGQERRIDLLSICYDWAFLNEGRFISLWRKEDRVHYSLQGKIGALPQRFKASACAFRGMWDEAGTLGNMEEALDFLRAWLLDKKEVDDLPPRCVRREGIG